MEFPTYNKHFLDTSVMRSMLLGCKAYKQYFKELFGRNSVYVSKYVQMEFRRSFISNILKFYFTLHIPGVHTIGDAIQIWSNQFASSKLKALLSFISYYLEKHPYDKKSPQDKERALIEISSLVKRLMVKSKTEFKTIGVNSTRCKRASIDLTLSGGDSAELFRKFLEKFDDVSSCRKECKVDSFFLSRYRSEAENFTAEAMGLPQRKENEGFLRIAAKLQNILDSEAKVCSCKYCEAIGDAVIALESPREMQLEHTDHSFDHLCPLIKQPHRKHSAEQTFLNTLASPKRP